MHQADRVKLQFGHLQGIPEEARCLAEHHKMTTIKARQKAYTTLYSDEQNCWLHRELCTLDGDQLQTEEKPSNEYMQCDYDLLESIWSPPQATAPSQENPPTSDATQQNPPTTETEQQYDFGHRAPRPRYCFMGTRFGPGHQY
ncbi:unnamed protein product [Vicia faba]|uniref:Uncharacterized protein n=1 Tax=Vicia faba TaxID=3906 RepID=A0AAV0YJE1_VICFA|nr:unnamed protein product [Vicia faba]